MTRFQHRLLFIAQSLTNHHIGLEETDDGIWSIFFNTVLLAKLDERDYIIRGSPVQRCYPCCRFTLLPISPVAQAELLERYTELVVEWVHFEDS